MSVSCSSILSGLYHSLTPWAMMAFQTRRGHSWTGAYSDEANNPTSRPGTGLSVHRGTSASTSGQVYKFQKKRGCPRSVTEASNASVISHKMRRIQVFRFAGKGVSALLGLPRSCAESLKLGQEPVDEIQCVGVNSIRIRHTSAVFTGQVRIDSQDNIRPSQQVRTA